MKTKTLTILFALVMVLSMSAGVFATDFTETWDEETVLTVFSDLDIVFPDLFADDDTDYLFAESPMVWNFPKDSKGKYVGKDISLDDLEAKAPIDNGATDVNKKPFMTAKFDPCGDGMIAFEMTIYRMSEEDYATAGYNANYYGPSRTTYIRKLTAKIDGVNAKIRNCTSSGGDNCRSIKFNSKGEAKISGYVFAPDVLIDKAKDGGINPVLTISVEHSSYMTALWDVEVEAPIETDPAEAAATKNDYCQPSLQEFQMAGYPSVRGRYDENTGEARFQATIRNYKSGDKVNYVIPADVYLVDQKERYTSYTCKYTIFNTPNAAPRTDYCKYGEGIALAPNAVIRFDITIDHLSGVKSGDLPFTFRVGGMEQLVGQYTGVDENGQPFDFNAVLEPVDFPCPPTTRMAVMNPLKPFMTFYGMESDSAISASGAYGVYDGGVWGLYQKCGKYAFMAVRLKNDGVQDEIVNLKNVAVAVNGGNPINWKWVLSTVEEDSKDKILLEPGMDVVLILRAKVTESPASLNSDAAMTGAVNFLDYGFYITGKVYSDHNNTNCVAP